MWWFWARHADESCSCTEVRLIYGEMVLVEEKIATIRRALGSAPVKAATTRSRDMKDTSLPPSAQCR